MSKFSEQLVALARSAGGSYKTVHDRSVIADRFADYLQQLNIQVRSIEFLKSKHIESYFAQRLEAGLGKRTLQNEAAAIRAVLNKSGRQKLVESDRLTNKNLGLAGASRKGTKAAISPERYKTILEASIGRDKGVAACLQLCRMLGLRSEEAVQASKSLATWSKMLKKGFGQLPIIFGTKGGRPRWVTLVDKQKVNEAVNFARQVAKENGGKLIERPGLKEAMDRFHNECRAVGLVGKEAPHSLRYAWAQERVAAYQEQGLSRREALAWTSEDLGHGDGRGHYVNHVYCK